MSDPIYADKDYYLGDDTGGGTSPEDLAVAVADALEAKVLTTKPPAAVDRENMLTLTWTFGASAVINAGELNTLMGSTGIHEVQFVVTAGECQINEDGGQTVLEVGDTWEQRAEPGMLLEEDWTVATLIDSEIKLTALGVA